jgi:Skp family chaperone for outer membrane proteins
MKREMNMSIVFKRLVPVLLLSLFMGGSAWAQPRIGTVDVRKVFDNYWKKKQAEIQLKERQADIEKEDKNMLEDYKRGKDEYQKLIAETTDQALSQDEKDKRKKKAEEKFRQLKDLEVTITQYENTARTTMLEQTDRMRANIIGDIKNVVSAKAKAAGYSLVIDTAAESLNKTPIILFTNNDNDITDEILAQLNSTAPVDLPKIPEQPASEEKKGKK